MKYTKLYYFVSKKEKDTTTRMKEKVVAGVDGGPRRFEPKHAS